MRFFYGLLIGAAAGFMAGQITRGRGFGLAGNVVLGVIGALIGSLVFGLFGFKATNTLASLISATVGSIILIFGLQRLSEKP